MVGPGSALFLEGWHFGFQIPQVRKVQSECGKCDFIDPNFKKFLEPPRLMHLTYIHWGGQHFQNSPPVELLLATPLCVCTICTYIQYVKIIYIINRLLNYAYNYLELYQHWMLTKWM